MLQIWVSLAEVKPMPMASDSATMVTLRWEKPALEIIWMPLTRMVPNIISVQPPSTDSGRLAKKLPIGGSNPARIMQPAPVMMVKRLTTPVMLISPTFWLKEVTGGQPNRPEMALA